MTIRCRNTSRVTITSWISIRSRITIKSRRIPIVERSRNPVRTAINIRFRNTNPYRGKSCTASDRMVKKH